MVAGMTRVALYARYSSDRQNERSIEDQVGVCTRHAQARGWTIVQVFSDAAISGSTMVNRPGLNAALQLAAAGGYDVLLAEDEDRLARNLEHQAHVFNRLRDLGIAIATLASDRIGILEVGLKGMMNEIYLDALSAKTKRGMASNAAKGLATGSRLYGYRSQPGGAIEIVDEEASMVRWIFAQYAGGATARQIAETLNRDGVPAPRGGLWNASTINGSRQRGTGILWSEIYAGVKTFGRIVEKKDRATGRRRVVCAPREDWQRIPVPHLRIVDEATWAAVQGRKTAESAVRPEQLVRRPGFLSGLVKCRCGASYTVLSTGRMGCAAVRERGSTACSNRRTLSKAAIEKRVLDGLQTRLLAPDAVSAYVEAYREAAKAQRAQAVNRRAPLERRIAALDRKAERLLDDLIELEKTDPRCVRIRERMAEAEAELADARAELASVPDAATADAPIELHPKAADTYRAQVAALQAYLETASKAAAPADQRLVDAARGLIDRIEIHPQSDEPVAPVDVVLHGKLAAFMDAGEHLDGSLCMGAVVVGGHCSRWHTAPTYAVRLRL